jgi:hypothetical protein
MLYFLKYCTDFDENWNCISTLAYIGKGKVHPITGHAGPEGE